MRRIQVVIREVDDQTAEPPKDLATFDLPTTDIAALSPETTLDDLEATTPIIRPSRVKEFPGLADPVYGYEGIARYGAKIAEVLDDYRMVPERFIDAGKKFRALATQKIKRAGLYQTLEHFAIGDSRTKPAAKILQRSEIPSLFAFPNRHCRSAFANMLDGSEPVADGVVAAVSDPADNRLRNKL